MDTGLRGKIAIVTGGASGIGRATVIKLAEEGAIPIYIDKDKKGGEELSEQLKINKKPYKFIFADLRDDKKCQDAVEEIINSYNQIDILINNAGKNDRCDIDNTSPRQFRQSLEGNLIHYYSMTHYCWPHLTKSKGNVVFVGSKVSLVGEGKTTAYAAAKGAINGMTRELATKSANEKLEIRVNCILPGIVRTPLYDEYIIETYGDFEKGNREFGKRIPLSQRPTTAEEVANTIVFLASDLSSHTTGQLISLDGGYVHIDRSVPEY